MASRTMTCAVCGLLRDFDVRGFCDECRPRASASRLSPRASRALAALVRETSRHEVHAITDDQIRALRSESGAAGDLAQVAMCDRALVDGEDSAAWRECLRVIADAAAMAADDEPLTDTFARVATAHGLDVEERRLVASAWVDLAVAGRKAVAS